MSSHFNYEIDERDLRDRLRNLEMPYREDAWMGFLEYSEQHPSSIKKSPLPNIRININRTLVLPFVFGAVILLFSLLLFNFISIKKKPENKVTANAPETKKPAPEVKKPVPAAPPVSVKKDSVIITTTPTVAAVQPTVEPVKPQVSATVAAITAENNLSSNNWLSLSNGKIYSSPNISSDVIGNSLQNKTYTAVEETVYFIKIDLGAGKFGYIMKGQLKKHGVSSDNSQLQTKPAEGTRKKRVKKAEVLESNQTPFRTSGNEEKEPELR